MEDAVLHVERLAPVGVCKVSYVAGKGQARSRTIALTRSRTSLKGLPCILGAGYLAMMAAGISDFAYWGTKSVTKLSKPLSVFISCWANISASFEVCEMIK